MSVYLVGAGPGDPGLITVRGLELLRRCDAVVYDVLVAPELIDEVPAGALTIPREGMSQEEVNRLLVTLARQGLETVRLKGGDPYVFGRGSEEALVLREAGIAVEVVAGVSALSSVPASAGIPITHRGVCAQVTVVSGHSASDAHLDYDQLAAAPGTLVVFMGLAHLAELASGLIDAGRDPSTPAAVISQGTTPTQQSVSGELVEIAELAAELASPALLVIGDVVDLAAKLGGGHATPTADALRHLSALR